MHDPLYMFALGCMTGSGCVAMLLIAFDSWPHK